MDQKRNETKNPAGADFLLYNYSSYMLSSKARTGIRYISFTKESNRIGQASWLRSDKVKAAAAANCLPLAGCSRLYFTNYTSSGILLPVF